MFRFTKTALKIILTNVCLRLLALVMSLLTGEKFCYVITSGKEPAILKDDVTIQTRLKNRVSESTV